MATPEEMVARTRQRMFDTICVMDNDDMVEFAQTIVMHTTVEERTLFIERCARMMAYVSEYGMR